MAKNVITTRFPSMGEIHQRIRRAELGRSWAARFGVIAPEDIAKWLNPDEMAELMADLMVGNYTVGQMVFDFAAVMKRQRSKKFRWLYSSKQEEQNVW